MKKNLITVGVCGVILLAGAAVVFLATIVESSSRKNNRTTNSSVSRTPAVEVLTVQTSTVEDRLTLTGTVSPWRVATISAETTGKIEWQGIDEGDLVTEGQDLIRVDTEAIRARYDQARAEATLAVQEYERARRLADRGVSPERDLDTAQASRDVAEANLRALEIQLRKSVIKAPFSGVVDKLFREQEEFVDVGAALVRLVQLHKVKVEVGVPERDIGCFAVGQAVRVRLDAIPERGFEGHIYRVATTADPVTHTFTTEIELDNVEGLMKPGMIARAALLRQTFPDSILIPIFSTFVLEGQRFAFVVVDGKAQLRPIGTGIAQGGQVQVVSGLKAGDQLIVKGQYDVRDGEPVQIQQMSGEKG